MRAQVPYLARLARRAAGLTPLRPPRPLFAPDPGLPGPEWPPFRPGESIDAERTDLDPSAPVATIPVATATAVPAAPAALGVPAAQAPDTATSPVASPALPAAPGALADATRAQERTPSRPGESIDAERTDLDPSAPVATIPVATATAVPAAPAALGVPAAQAPDTATPPVAPSALPAAPGAPALPIGPSALATPGTLAPQAATRVPPAARTESVRTARTALTGRADASLAGPGTTPVPPGGSPTAANATRAQPPTSWMTALWGGPVDLPQTISVPPAAETTGLPHATGETGGWTADGAMGGRPAARKTDSGAATRMTAGRTTPREMRDPATAGGRGTWTAVGLRSQPDVLPNGRGADGTGGSYRDGHEGGTGASVTLSARTDAGSDRSPEPAAAGHLLPPTPASRSVGPEPAGARQSRPRVSIGTIEVTVVRSPPLPAPEIHEARPPARAAGGGAGRLQDGLRRWYGIAQG